MSSPAVARTARRRDGTDVGPRHRRANRTAAAVPRADPARAQGRRTRALQARRRRRLRAGPPARRDPAVRDRVRCRRSDHARRLRRAARRTVPAITRASACCWRSGSRPARSCGTTSTGSRWRRSPTSPAATLPGPPSLLTHVAELDGPPTFNCPGRADAAWSVDRRDRRPVRCDTSPARPSPDGRTRARRRAGRAARAAGSAGVGRTSGRRRADG